MKIQLLSPAEIGFHYELSFFKSGNTTVDTGNLGKVPLSRYIDFKYYFCTNPKLI